MDRKFNINNSIKFLIFFIIISFLRMMLSLMDKSLLLIGFPLVFLKVYDNMKPILSRISFNLFYFLLDLLILYFVYKLIGKILPDGR